jgi:outer membrane protein assembly factor BamB
VIVVTSVFYELSTNPEALMNRRGYLAALVAIGGAGCLSNETTPDQQSEDSPTQTTPEKQASTPTYDPPTDSPPGEFTPLTDPGLWEYEFQEVSHRIPTAVGTGVYVVEGTTLTHLSPAGETQWAVDSAPAYRPDLTVSEGSVYHLSSSNFESYDPASGEERWQKLISDVGSLSLSEVAEESVFVSETSDDPGEFLALAFDAETGEERWRTVTGMETHSTVTHGLWLISSPVDGLTALDTATGEVRWERTPSSELGGPVLAVDDTLCLFRDGTVHGYALPDGTHRWEQSLSGDAGFIQRPPSGSAQAADLYIADDRANLTALNARTGDKQWTVTTHWGNEGYEGMCLGTDSLYYHSGTALASYDLMDGSRQWAYSLGSEYNASGPVIAPGTVFLITQQTDQEPTVKAFDAKTGSREWRVQLTTGDSFPPQVSGVFNEYIVLKTDSRLIGLPVTPSAI